MKKIIVLFCVCLLMAGCSSDDDDNKNGKVDITFPGNDLVKLDPSETKCYYFSKNYNLFVSNFGYPDHHKACDAICPNEEGDHKNSKYIKVDTGIGGDIVFVCRGCQAQYKYNTGEPLNEEANGHTLKIYNFSWDVGKNMYRVWSE